MRIHEWSNEMMKTHICRSRNTLLLVITWLFFSGYVANCTAAPIKNQAPSVDEQGNVAVVNLGTGINTTVTLNWKGFYGALGLSRIIYISTTPASGGTFQNARIIKISNLADSCVVHGLPPGTYYWVIGQDYRNINTFHPGVTQRFSNVVRIVVSPPKP